MLQLTTAGSPEHTLVWLTPMVAGAGSGVHARPASARSAWTTLRVMPLRGSVIARPVLVMATFVSAADVEGDA